MAWQDVMIPMVQEIIGDTTVYTSGRLATSICIAAKFVNAELFNTFTVTNSSISPDPTDPYNTWFVNLTVAKTACMLGNAEMRVSAGQGIAIKDGPSSLDLKGISQYKANAAKMFCKNYEDMKFAYLNGGNINAPGGNGYQGITSPLDLGYYNGYPYGRPTRY